MVINGNLKFAGLGVGELQNAIMERLSTTARDLLTATAPAGQIIFNVTTAKYNYFDGTEWVIIATGGDATALQNEVNAIETASGGIYLAADGTFDAVTVDSALGNVTSSTSLLNVLAQLDSAITTAAGVDTLGELSDVTITTAATDDMLVFTGAQWEDRTAVQVQAHLSLVPSTDIQVWDANLDDLAAIVPVSGDVIYASGTTWVAAPTGSTSGVQKWDAGLDSISGLTTAADQLIYTTGVDTYAVSSLTTYMRTLLDDANAATAQATLELVIGTNVQAWDLDLDQIAAAANVIGDILYTNASGIWAVAGPGTTSGVQAWDVNLDEIAALTALDSTFIVGDGTSWVAETGATVRTSLDVFSTSEATNAFVNVSGDTMAGILNMGTFTITSLGAPAVDTDAANKAYVDARVAGLTWKNSVLVGSTANIDLTAGGLIAVDGVTVAAADRVLVMSQTAPAENGIYDVTVGAWTRSTDFDELAPLDEINSAAVFIQQGATLADSGWTVTSTVATLDTDAIIFTQFNGAAGITAGIGLVKVGNTLDVNMGAGIVALPSDEVGIDLLASEALHLTVDGTTDSVATGAKLALFIEGTTLTQSALGLKVPAQGITETQLHTSVAGLGLIGGAGTALSVNVDASTLELAGDVVQVADGGITNAKLANSVITIAADTGTADPVSLGETFTVTGGTNLASTVSANAVTIDWSAVISDLGDVNTVGVVSGDTLIWDGVSSWVPGNPINSTSELTDVTTAATVAGQVLVANGSNNYVPSQIHYVYDGAAASASHVVTHALGQQFCNVTVIDGSNSVIIPQSIVMDSASQLTVTFNVAIACKVIVTGVAGV